MNRPKVPVDAHWDPGQGGAAALVDAVYRFPSSSDTLNRAHRHPEMRPRLGSSAPC
jgi:hypothetical protein